LKYYSVGLDQACDNDKEHIAGYHCNDCGIDFEVVEPHNFAETSPYKCECGMTNPDAICNKCWNLKDDCVCW
jgi:hypothetical protein